MLCSMIYYVAQLGLELKTLESECIVLNHEALVLPALLCISTTRLFKDTPERSAEA